MSSITVDQIKQLREETGAPVMECRSALEEAGGDFKIATEILKKKGAQRAAKKSSRETKSGRIEVYSHNEGKIGVMVEVSCETDFVARNDEFKNLTHEICLQIASMKPQNVEELLKQPWIRDDKKTIEDLVKELIAKIGENMEVRRFERYEIGE